MNARHLRLTFATAGVAALSGCAGLQLPPRDPILPDIRSADRPDADNAAPEEADAAPRKPPVIVAGEGVRAALPGVASRTSGGYVVNLSDADLVEATRVILGDLLGAAFTVDPGVQGRVTLSGSSTLSETDLIALFETALRQNGAALLRQGDAYRVAALVDAQTAGQLLAAGEPGYGVTAIPLRFMGAEAARTLLEGVVIRPGGVRADIARNLLLISGSQAERIAAADTIAALDIDWVASSAVGIFPVVSSDPQSLVAELEAIFQSAPGAPAAGSLRLRALPRLSSILAIAGDRERLDRLGEWIERLDVEAEDTTVLRTYFLDSGKAEETAQLLNELLSGRAAAPPVTAPGDAAVSGTTSASGVGAVSGGSLPPGGVRIIADKLNNAVLVLADASGQKLVRRALNDIDRAPAQVQVDATIVEVTLSDRLRYGVQWFFETNGVAGVADSGRGGLSRGTGFDANGVFPGFNFLMESGDGARLAIDALSAVTNVNVRSSPTLIVMDNQSATLRVGDRVPVVTRQASGVETDNSPIINQIEFRDTGVILTVTPRVSSTSVVTLDIDQEVSSVSETVNTGALTPTISQRRIQSTVAIRSGQTLVLGGLIDESGNRSRSGVPWLSRAPLIGPLFSSTDDNSRRTELIVFLTPRVLRTEDDASVAASEIRSRMQSIIMEDERRRERGPSLFRSQPAPRSTAPASPGGDFGGADTGLDLPRPPAQERGVPPARIE